ncbi:unnamed protein product [Fusarium venenatum]|uniref:Uncharacterized protein n=1 Tax=Fusarium venenatum TaxID=56646 RepID=A0A2L2TTM2_9HYPO|nr:uncharacterized protein FVRRES_09868 [Fusarium venenatum]CEI69791.1 unnamed protein product [Fusarium venenatum]
MSIVYDCCEDGKVGWEDGERRGFMAGTSQAEYQSWRRSRTTIVEYGHNNNSKLAVPVTGEQLHAQETRAENNCNAKRSNLAGFLVLPLDRIYH